MPSLEPIIPLNPLQQYQTMEVICQTFKNDPAGLYITADATKRAYILSWFANTGLTLGFKYGEIFTTSEITGVAVWFRPGYAHMSWWTMLSEGIFPPFQAGPATLWRFFKVMACFERVHREHVPENHWYLCILTIAPAHQGQGLGGRLIRPILDRADAADLPCYLETANPKSVPFYEKHGFKVVHQAQLPGSSTPFWGLRREPR